MAIYGKDFYGLAKYGADLRAEFSVEPFEAVPVGYNTITLSWVNPSGSWSQFRLLKSKVGYAVNQNDGQILIDSTGSVATAYSDGDLTGGTFYYYTIYLKSGDDWFRAGLVSQLAVSKRNFMGLLWDRIPRYFHYVPKYPDGTLKEYFNSAEVYDPSRTDQINQGLQQFLMVLGWGFDFLRDYQESVLWANDPRLLHLENVERLAGTLGTEIEYEVPAWVNRAKVANAALLARRRGSVLGLEDLARLSTGYDYQVQVANNLMLNRDQGSFDNPDFPEWDPGVLYSPGVEVQSRGSVYTCLVAAIGTNQQPPMAPITTNTWWQAVSNGSLLNNDGTNPTYNATTGAINNWKGYKGQTTPTDTPEDTRLAISVTSPFDSSDITSNALYVRNNFGSSAGMTVWGAANPITDGTRLPSPITAINQGIPVPRLLQWDETVTYTSGMLVLYKCRSFRALRENIGRNPDQFTNDWQQAGIDERPKIGFSFYSHADFDGSAGVAITPGMAFYDQRGNLLSTLTSVNGTGLVFDTFNGSPNTLLSAHNPDVRTAETWTINSGTWELVEQSDTERLVCPIDGAGVALTTMTAEVTKYKVAVTFTDQPLAGKTQYLALRYVDASNYMRVSRTTVSKVVTGTPTTLVTFATAIKDGDRVTVWMEEDTNTQTYYVNGVQVGQTTGQPQPAAGVGSNRYRHGMVVL